MRILLTEKRNGVRHVRWAAALGLAATLALFGGLLCGLVFYLLAGHWNLFWVLSGAAMGILCIVRSIVNDLRTPQV